MHGTFSSVRFRHILRATFLGLLSASLQQLAAQEVTSMDSLRSQFFQERTLLDAPIGELNSLYEKQLGALREKLRAAGDLEKVLAVDDELKSYSTADRSDPPASFPDLDRLRGIYRSELERRRKEIAVRMPRALESYATRLDALATELTKLNRLPEAIAAKEEAARARKEITVTPSAEPKENSDIAAPSSTAAAGRLKGVGFGPKEDPLGETGRNIVDAIAVKYWERDTFDSGWVALRANGILLSDKERRLTTGGDRLIAFDCSRGGIIGVKEDGTVETSMTTLEPPAEVVPQLIDVTDITLGKAEGGPGDETVVALKKDGSLVWWGPPTKGVGVSGPPEEARVDVVHVVANRGTFTALKRDGSVVAWKFQTGGDGRVSLPNEAQRGPFKQLAMSESHTVALREDGSVVAWGANNEGQCSVPADLGPCIEVAVLQNVGTLARKEDGSWVAWGRSYGGLIEKLQGMKNATGIVGRMFPPGGFASAVWIEEKPKD